MYSKVTLNKIKCARLNDRNTAYERYTSWEALSIFAIIHHKYVKTMILPSNKYAKFRHCINGHLFIFIWQILRKWCKSWAKTWFKSHKLFLKNNAQQQIQMVNGIESTMNLNGCKKKKRKQNKPNRNMKGRKESPFTKTNLLKCKSISFLFILANFQACAKELNTLLRAMTKIVSTNSGISFVSPHSWLDK